MNFTVILFKDSNCDLCKLMQRELMDNPPAAELKIVHANAEECSEEIDLYNINYFPTTILLDNNDNIVNRFEGFVDSKSIDINIKQYETKCLV